MKVDDRGWLVRADGDPAVQQGLVDRLKSASHGGVLAPGQRDQAMQAALASAKNQLGPHGRALLVDAFGFDELGVETLLQIRIEAAVHAIKTAARAQACWTPGTAGDPVPFTE
jgi:hypothetical protein